ncbi:hypothetical protein MNBD_BACTEROID06-1494 [hydrothermal vent metagenome]|uniref:Two component regulator three Y domain-containing protein n=1 Tax=hydrothermal vent metagenome TaxID=652676 RepID=A0A3B0UGB3_9ZZZZ
MKSIFTTALCILSFTSIAQTGSYYLTQYNLNDHGLSNYNFDIVQDSRGLVYMANLKGVLVSDGLDWSIIETPYSIFALDFDDKDHLYVGGRKEIAVINKTEKSSESYHLISKVNQEVFEIKYHNHQVYFLSESTLYIYDIASKKIRVVKNPTKDLFSSLVEIDGTLYVASVESGVQSLTDGKLMPAKVKLPQNTKRAIHSKKGDQLIISDNTYFIKKAGEVNYEELIIKDDGYLQQNTPADVNWVNSNLLAISTISGGVVFINASTGKVTQYMNYENGLLDNEILTLFVGKNNVVWCATPQGVSIIAPEIPIRNFAGYSGLSGNIQVVYDFDKRLFVGTSIGLYELVKKSVFEDVISYKKITSAEEVVLEPEPPKKKGLFRRKNKRTTPITTTKAKNSYKKQVKKQLLSQSYEFEKIANIDAKIAQLVDFNGKLLIGSLSGVYQLEEKKAVRIFEEPVMYMYKPDDFNFLMVSTYTKEVKVLKPTADKWVTTGLLNGLDDFVEQIEQGKNGSLWLCGADSLYRIVLSNAHSLDDVEVYPINNPHWERIYSNTYQGKTYFLNTSGYYYYEDQEIKKDTIIARQIGLPKEFILSSKNKLWVNTGHFWYGQGQDLRNSLNFISLFEDPRYISELADNKFWVVTGNNQLYKIDGEKIKSITRKFELFLEKAEKDSVALPLTPLLGNIEQQSSLSFKFASPDYTNIYQTEYQYRLVGLSTDWSEWSKQNNEIIFPYLPAGTYKLEVRARDALGNVKNSESISFGILAPYWKRPWFYLAELLFFGGLMALSIFINRKKHKFSILSRLLTFLTLIFIVEFVQTIAEAKFETNQSPVINFFIQVAIAFSILPVEGVLRKFITKRQQKEEDKVLQEKAKRDPEKDT